MSDVPMKLLLCFFCFLIALGCTTKKDEKYYSNGNKEYEIEYQNGLQDGDTKTYYETGQLKYAGKYQGGKRIGKHVSYYPDGKIKHEYEYTIENGKEKFVSKKEYGTSGLISFESRFSAKEIVIEDNGNGEYNVGDTVFLKLELLNPTYENCMVVLGSFDEYLNVLEGPKEVPTPFMGNQNHEVQFWVKAEVNGANKLTGIIRDFTIKAINDTLGYTLAEDSYFEYRFRVKDKRII